MDSGPVLWRSLCTVGLIRGRTDRLELLRRNRVQDLLGLLFLLLVRLGLGVAGDADGVQLALGAPDDRQPGDLVALLPAEPLDVEIGHLDGGRLAAVRAGTVVLVTSLDDQLHVLARRLNAHNVKPTRGRLV